MCTNLIHVEIQTFATIVNSKYMEFGKTNYILQSTILDRCHSLAQGFFCLLVSEVGVDTSLPTCLGSRTVANRCPIFGLALACKMALTMSWQLASQRKMKRRF